MFILQQENAELCQLNGQLQAEVNSVQRLAEVNSVQRVASFTDVGKCSRLISFTDVGKCSRLISSVVNCLNTDDAWAL